MELHLESIINGTYQLIEPEDEGNLYLKDFNELLHLDLEEISSVGNTIDRLRALTHENYKNAYFIDALSGKKIYVTIQLTPEEDE